MEISDERKFKNVLEATGYLQAEGWKVRKSSMYRHIQEGKLRAASDGTFTEKSVLKYARLFLKRLDGTTPRRGERAQQDKVEAESRKLAAQARLWEMKAAILEGNYVLKTEFETALAQRAMIFKNDLEYFCYSSAPEIIRLVDGDISKVSELIEAMKESVADLLNRYADKRGFTPLPLHDFGIESEIMQDDDISKTDMDDEDD